ncbi:hypothetical protein [Segetibacter aerophilus]|nr:hypothetical protein [Segetibacter aerophilus]
MWRLIKEWISVLRPDWQFPFFIAIFAMLFAIFETLEDILHVLEKLLLKN